MKRKSALFLLILMVNFYILGNPSPILTSSAALNDTITDPIGDANMAFVDIVNATVSRNETYFNFSVFTLEEIPTNTFATEGQDFGDSHDSYDVFFTLLINTKIFYVRLEWISSPWEAYVMPFDPNTNETGSPIWNGSVEHIGIQLNVQVLTSILENPSEFEWFVRINYWHWDKIDEYSTVTENASDICPDGGVPWWEKPIFPQGTAGYSSDPENIEDIILDFLGIPIFGMPWSLWLLIIVATPVILYMLYKSGPL